MRSTGICKSEHRLQLSDSCAPVAGRGESGRPRASSRWHASTRVILRLASPQLGMHRTSMLR